MLSKVSLIDSSFFYEIFGRNGFQMLAAGIVVDTSNWLVFDLWSMSVPLFFFFSSICRKTFWLIQSKRQDYTPWQQVKSPIWLQLPKKFTCNSSFLMFNIFVTTSKNFVTNEGIHKCTYEPLAPEFISKLLIAAEITYSWHDIATGVDYSSQLLLDFSCLTQLRDPI